ncbi:MAG TPA: lipopolysaccharide biosynthesis protein, partial [Candidatus Latescibacteria bacterium]|nr:lipopolysaccharide biosynthesis protein [Candidatus Latescibacterota bacterium]
MPDPQQTHLLDYLYVLIRWRRLIIMGTLLAAVGAAGISLMLPERFTARTILLPPAEEPKGLGLSLLAGGGSGLPA